MHSLNGRLLIAASVVLAAFLGPMLARHTRELAATPFVASFAALVGVALLAALLTYGFERPVSRRLLEKTGKKQKRA